MEEIKVGDVVCLRSGGSNMVVSTVWMADPACNPPSQVTCVWMTGEGDVNEADFDVAMLTRLY